MVVSAFMTFKVSQNSKVADNGRTELASCAFQENTREILGGPGNF